jgi:hypothetical protein
MNETVVCKPSPVKILAVSAASLRELLSFLIYGEYAELLTERVRQPPSLYWENSSNSKRIRIYSQGGKPR